MVWYSVLCCGIVCCVVLCCVVLCCVVLCCVVFCCGRVCRGIVLCCIVWCGAVCCVLHYFLVWCVFVWSCVFFFLLLCAGYLTAASVFCFFSKMYYADAVRSYHRLHINCQDRHLRLANNSKSNYFMSNLFQGQTSFKKVA